MASKPIAATKRGKSMVIAGIIAAAATGWTGWKASHPVVTPAAIHQAIDKGISPPAVEIALELIGPWEGIRTVAYLDPIGIPTVCKGETEINGKPVRLGMRFTVEECEAMFRKRVTNDFYLKLVDGLPGFVEAPDSVQAASLSVIYNAGPGVLTSATSTAGKAIRTKRYADACRGLTLFNKARIKGRLVVMTGLDNRRTMGDKSRVGEAEVCLNTEVSS
ncbi:lysozyme [Rhizobium wenxiniae]|uniref:lysozyme n=1 Tax=Rhizobium wenxiniae TaxID=1737357 RepID=UPI003C1752E4